MLVKLDEDLSEAVAVPIRNAGHDVRTVRGQGWQGMLDGALWPRIVAEGAFFVTADKGFGDLRAFPAGTHPGLLVLRPDRESIPAFSDLVAEVLVHHDLEELRGCVAVASPRGVRVRRARG